MHRRIFFIKQDHNENKEHSSCLNEKKSVESAEQFSSRFNFEFCKFTVIAELDTAILVKKTARDYRVKTDND